MLSCGFDLARRSCRRQLGRWERGKCSRFTVSPNLQLCTKQPHPRLNPPLEGSGLPTSMLSCGFDLIRRKQQRRPLNPVIARSVATWQSRIVNKSSEASILKGYKKYVRYAHSLRRWIATSWLRGFAATPLLAMTGFGDSLRCLCLAKLKSHDNILVGKPEPSRGCCARQLIIGTWLNAPKQSPSAGLGWGWGQPRMRLCND